jgi:hypothetical protein
VGAITADRVTAAAGAGLVFEERARSVFPFTVVAGAADWRFAATVGIAVVAAATTGVAGVVSVIFGVCAELAAAALSFSLNESTPEASALSSGELFVLEAWLRICGTAGGKFETARRGCRAGASFSSV